MVTRVIQPSSDRPLLNESGAPSQQFNQWLRQVTIRMPISGTGNPEGVVEAEQFALYMDLSGTSGNILYIKRDSDIAGDKTQGWILV